MDPISYTVQIVAIFTVLLLSALVKEIRHRYVYLMFLYAVLSHPVIEFIPYAYVGLVVYHFLDFAAHSTRK